ncbi:MAG: hypothetical protein ACMUHX_04170, partial [bacterium]
KENLSSPLLTKIWFWVISQALIWASLVSKKYPDFLYMEASGLQNVLKYSVLSMSSVVIFLFHREYRGHGVNQPLLRNRLIL